MKNNFKITIPLAIAITLIAMIYQRATGPTYPKKFTIDPEQKSVKIKLPRSHGGTTDALLEIPYLYDDMKAIVYFKRFPTEDAWSQRELVLEENGKVKRLVARLDNQPPAGKFIYHLDLSYNGKTQRLGTRAKPIMIRFKGHVPTFVLAPHVIFMIIGMLLSSLSGFEALFRTESFRKIGFLTAGCLFTGAGILGPIVQKYAFGVYWAGFPYGWDLTDNKSLVFLIFWAVAVILNWKRPRVTPVIIAALVVLAMYSIPHSMMGSQYNYKTNKVETDR